MRQREPCILKGRPRVRRGQRRHFLLLGVGRENFNMSSNLLPKPQMRDLLGKIARRNFLIGVTLVTGGFFFLEHFLIQKRQNQYRDFYKTFDFVKDFEDKKKAGVFQSVKP